MPKGDGRPSPFGMILEWISSFLPAAAPTIILIVDLLLVENVSAGSTDYGANRRALSAADQRAGQCADASASRRAPNRFAPGVLAVVIIAPVAIASEIIVVIPGRGEASLAAPVLRHRAWSGGGD